MTAWPYWNLQIQETSKFNAVNSDTLLPLDKESRIRRNNQKNSKQFFSYWNGFPDDSITSKSLNIFKNKIDKLYENSEYYREFQYHLTVWVLT